MATQTVHFTIGKNLGVRLHEISLEHLNRYDLKKALNVWIKSFRCNKEIAAKLTSMDFICDIDTSTQEAVVIPKKNVHKKRLADYPDFSLSKYFKNCEQYAYDIAQYGYRIILGEQRLANLDLFLKSEINLQQWCETNPSRNADFSLNKNDVKDYLQRVKKFLTHDKNKIIAIFQQYGYEFHEFMGYSYMVEEFFTTIKEHIGKKLDNPSNPSPKVKKTTSTEFAPCNILDKYDCGWLAPNGDFFGMNGIKAQMCHIRLAEKICKYYNFKVDYQLEYNYLETHQFIKIDRNWILYDGEDENHNYHHITDKQLSVLITYGEQLYEQKLFFGYQKLFCSTVRLKSMDKFALRKFLEF